MIYFARVVLFTLFVAAIGMLPGLLHGQALPASGGGGDYGLEPGDIPRREIGFNYNYMHANAPPGQCGCFSLNGGSASGILNIRPHWSAVADLTVAHADNVDNTQQSITIINYLFGPRYTWRTHTRYVPYAQVLFGGAKEDVNFEFVINRNSFGLSAGGGVTTRLSRRFALNIIQLDYVYTQIPNARSNRQNNVRVATGLITRF